MNVQPNNENMAAGPDVAPSAGRLDAVANFAISVGGVKKGDVVAEINTRDDSFTQRLRQLGARVVSVDRWMSPGAKSLSMAPASVDVIIASMVLHHMHFPAVTIAEMKRMLRPGGRLVITDMGRIGEVLAGRERCRQWAGFYISDIRHWLKSAGFSNIIVNPVPCQLLGFDARRSKADGCTDIFMATGTA